MTQSKVAEEARHKLQQLQDEINKRESEISKLSQNIKVKDANMTKIVVTEQINRVENKEFRDLVTRKDK